MGSLLSPVILISEIVRNSLFKKNIVLFCITIEQHHATDHFWLGWEWIVQLCIFVFIAYLA